MRVIRSPEAYTALNYDVWSNPDSNVCRASVVSTSVQLTSLSEDRILYWLCDVALVVKAATSASKTRIQLGTEWMFIKPFKCGIIPASPSSHTSFCMSNFRQYSHTQNNVPIKIHVESKFEVLGHHWGCWCPVVLGHPQAQWWPR